MRHVRMLGLCLVAALALGAYAVSSASALEFGECRFVETGGNYTGPNCNKLAGEAAKPKGSGDYEWIKGAELEPRHFTGQSVGGGGVLTLLPRFCQASGGGNYQGRVTRAACAEKGGEQVIPGEVAEVECEAENNHGVITGKASITKIQVTFKGCKLFGSVPCANTPVEGEISVNLLKGKLGYISKSEHKVGVLLEPEVKHGEFAKFDCGGAINIVVGVGNKKEGAEYTSSGCSGVCEGATPEEEKHGGYDGIISPITPVNVMASHFTQVYTVNEASQNIPSSFEGKHIDLLEAYLYFPSSPETGIEWSRAGEEITNENVVCAESVKGNPVNCEEYRGLGEIKG